MTIREWIELQSGAPADEWSVHSFQKPAPFDVMNELLPLMEAGKIPGLYVIMVADPNFPGGFRPIWFGEAEDIYTRPQTHEKLPEWRRLANGKPLYISYHSMFGATEKERKVAETCLITKYRPWLCNEKLSVA